MKSASSNDTYLELQPTRQSVMAPDTEHLVPNRKDTIKYAKSLFPISTWIYRYNWTWLLGDLVAGITVGVVVIPQGMAYAKLATLSPEFGLYSSFVGCALYFMFATSKDITIGPVAVMSILLGNALNDVVPDLPEYYQERRWLLIPLPAIAAFMTGSAINIAMGQVPGMLGNNTVKGYDTREATYKVFINFFRYIKHCNINAAVGLSALIILYLIRWSCQKAAWRWPQHERMFFFLSTLRTAFVILLYTLISFIVNRNHRDDPKFAILGKVPKGFQHIELPQVNITLVDALKSKIPPTVIVLIIEHVSISKSFGRLSNYAINPNQELIAIGISNIFGPFFGAYPVTGSFSRTAIKYKAGVRTPLAGVFTALMIVFAIFVLPPMFYYIPNAQLAAVIIHAVGDLISAPRTIMAFWRISPFEFLIFWAGVTVSLFSTIDTGIYTTVALSAALMLFRIAKAQGKFVGQIKVYEQQLISEDNQMPQERHVYIPLDHSDGTNPSVKPKPPPNGIFIYRMSEGYLYLNAVHFTDLLVKEILKQTRPGVVNPYGSLGNRPWNDPGPRHKTESDIDIGVSNVDITSIQNLIDVRRQLDQHADCAVAWHFAGVKSPWIRRALVSSGFGASSTMTRTIFSVQLQHDPAALLSANHPNFHIDLDEALKATEQELRMYQDY
ncbi:sulfate permease [Linderina pennispora]|uniref:Sulfate permease n=1 Tax=Linderina pennispora TaxID=61395 RepID=A0A1Y1W304_9FUNG|nr:sulfate permease [Linderina pennispora]ORX67665.1 sulfate permease [Linderina pennispora]